MRGSKIYIRNINYSLTKENLVQLFSNYGEVKHVKNVKKEI